MENSQIEILYFRLEDGLELISGTTQNVDGKIVLYKPVVVYWVDGEPQLTHFMPLRDSDEVILVQGSIISVASPNDSVVDAYKKAIGDSVIEVPEKKIII